MVNPTHISHTASVNDVNATRETTWSINKRGRARKTPEFVRRSTQMQIDFFGRLELVLMNREGRQMTRHTPQRWRRRYCPELARAFSEGKHSVAREALGV